MSSTRDHTTKLLIGGQLVTGAGASIRVENPYTTETIVDLQAASPEQVDAAVATAREAWPAWARTTAGDAASCSTRWRDGCARAPRSSPAGTPTGSTAE